MLSAPFGFEDVLLRISTPLAEAMRLPKGLVHTGSVTFKLSEDVPAVLTVTFNDPALIDGLEGA